MWQEKKSAVVEGVLNLLVLLESAPLFWAEYLPHLLQASPTHVFLYLQSYLKISLSCHVTCECRKEVFCEGSHLQTFLQLFGNFRNDSVRRIFNLCMFKMNGSAPGLSLSEVCDVAQCMTTFCSDPVAALKDKWGKTQKDSELRKGHSRHHPNA